MKKLLAASLCIVVGLLLGILLVGSTIHAGVGGTASSNGDVNGDGDIDISDAVYLLVALFKGGPPPVACADSPELLSRVVALETALAEMHVMTPEQAEILSHLSLVQLPVDDQGNTATTIRITSANLQIVNGLGATNGLPPSPIDGSPDETNGMGNLIVGYQEPRPSGNTRHGSHNLVVGDLHNYTSYGCLIAGTEHQVVARYGAAVGGLRSTVTGDFAATLGGVRNVASGGQATVSGGEANTASGTRASVSGGFGNVAPGQHSAITGGLQNTASGLNAVISGGRDNTASGWFSSITGGELNRAIGMRSSVAGGTDNGANGDSSTIGGGRLRTVDGDNDWRAGELFQDQ